MLLITPGEWWMPAKKDATYEQLVAQMEERSRPVLEKFSQLSTLYVNNSELLSILSEVKAYWQDTFRPALTSFSCEAVGGDPKAADEVSLMITLMAAGLGIHDDIIDRSYSKHFRKTILGLHGVDDALLIGELFIVKSLTTVRELARNNLPLKRVERTIDAFEKFFLEVWEGEFMETRCRKNLETELEYYNRILWMSTADTEACTRLGALFGGGSENEIEALAEVGRRLGYIFRLADEIKDTLNVEGNLQSRLEDESVPLPIMHAAWTSKRAKSVIKKLLKKRRVSPSDIMVILKTCLETDSFNYTLDLARLNEQKALSRIRELRKSEAQNALTVLVKNAFGRVATLCLSA
jgi:geranylgeranyl pyrophosphate synthase